MSTSNGLVLGLLCFALMAAVATARQFRVGGAKGWSVPDATAEPYNAWAGRLRFLIGDQLLFVYPKDTDSVLLVDQAAYDACNTTAYLAKFEDGSTVFTFDRSGPFFFISGNQASCSANEKLIVVVLSPNHTPPGLLPTPPSSMPPTSAPPVPSPTSSPPSPSSMTPPAGAPMPSPLSPPSMAPPSGAPMPSPTSPPSMAPPMSPPSGAPMPTPESAPSPTGSAPGAPPAATPGSPPSSPGSPGSPPSPGTPGGAPQPPADSTSPPGADGANTTAPGSGAGQKLTAGLIGTLAAGLGYAMLAV